MNFQQDYTQGKNQYELMRAMGQNAAQPIQGASALTALGKILTAHFAKKGMDKGELEMQNATQGREDARLTDLSRAMGAYRGDTPHEADLFPGEAPIEGVYDKGTGQNRTALMESMIGAQTPEIQNAGIKAMMAAPKTINRMGKYNPGDFTPESWAAFVQAGGGDNASGMLQRYEKPWVGDVGGVKSMVNTGTSTPGAVTPLSTIEKEANAAATVAGATEGAKLEEQLDKKPDIAKEVKLAEATAKKANAAFDQIDTIQGNIFNLKDAADLVRDGAATGPLMSILPSVRANSVALDNMQGRLGLDVVGAVTFGALSKGELDLAKSVALPTKLDGPELIKWIDEKIASQEKLMRYVESQATFLSGGGTQAEWREEAKRLYAAKPASTGRFQIEVIE